MSSLDGGSGERGCVFYGGHDFLSCVGKLWGENWKYSMEDIRVYMSSTTFMGPCRASETNKEGQYSDIIVHMRMFRLQMSRNNVFYKW